MAEVSTNSTSFRSKRSDETVWRIVEVNDPDDIGAQTASVARDPISEDEQEREGTLSDLDSPFGITVDATYSLMRDIVEPMMWSTLEGGGTFVPTAVTGTGLTVAAGGDLAEGTLVFIRGLPVLADNGLKVVESGSTATNIAISGLTVNASPPPNVLVEIAGVQGDTGDIEVDADGNLISTTLDFTTLPLVVGQRIFVGGQLTANKFNALTGVDRSAQIDSISANEIILTRQGSTFTTDAGAGKTIQLLYGQFIKKVSVSDPLYKNIDTDFEITYPDLLTGPVDGYEYARGNKLAQAVFNIPLTDKVTVALTYVGTDTPPPTASRDAGAANALAPVATSAYGTTPDISRILVEDVDGSGLTSDFTSQTLTINNQAEAQKVIGLLGARFINRGNLQVTTSQDVLFTNADVLTRVRNNTTVSQFTGFRNNESAVYFDIYSTKLSATARGFPRNQNVSVSLDGRGFRDPTLGTTIGISLIPFVPAA